MKKKWIILLSFTCTVLALIGVGTAVGKYKNSTDVSSEISLYVDVNYLVYYHSFDSAGNDYVFHIDQVDDQDDTVIIPAAPYSDLTFSGWSLTGFGLDIVEYNSSVCKDPRNVIHAGEELSFATLLMWQNSISKVITSYQNRIIVHLYDMYEEHALNFVQYPTYHSEWLRSEPDQSAGLLVQVFSVNKQDPANRLCIINNFEYEEYSSIPIHTGIYWNVISNTSGSSSIDNADAQGYVYSYRTGTWTSADAEFKTGQLGPRGCLAPGTVLYMSGIVTKRTCVVCRDENLDGICDNQNMNFTTFSKIELTPCGKAVPAGE